MTLKEECEILRGQPILLKTPVEEVPCNETSNPKQLCRNPVVSVHMLTYNHEPYIREAIEGVMTQETDFEFELVIGEDASQDRTREICFEYQKKYPDKIRVLWSEENVTKPYGGNGSRVTARCRGEFIAFCEGDDYWTDPKKLQKQVDVMRANPTVGLCHCGCVHYWQDTETCELWAGGKILPSGFISGTEHASWQIFGKNPASGGLGKESFLMTVTTLVRKSVLEKGLTKYEIFSWRLSLGDLTLWLAISSLSDVYFISEPVAVYRRHRGGAVMSNGSRVWLDGSVVRLYFAREIFGKQLRQVPISLRNTFILAYCEALPLTRSEQMEKTKKMLQVPGAWRAFMFSRYWPFVLLMRFGFVTRRVCHLLWRYVSVCNKWIGAE